MYYELLILLILSIYILFLKIDFKTKSILIFLVILGIIIRYFIIKIFKYILNNMNLFIYIYLLFIIVILVIKKF